jgi:hypothetical protein
MVIDNDVISLNKAEVMKLINKECNDRLQMSITQFIKKQQNKELPRSTAVHDILMMLKLAE